MLEKMLDKDDLMNIGWTVFLTSAVTALYAVASTDEVRNMTDTALAHKEHSYAAMREFLSVAKYSIPGSALVGYAASRIFRRK